MKRRTFVRSGLAAAILAPGAVTLSPFGRLSPRELAAQRQQRGPEDYDAMAKLANNENPWGPPESAMQAMTKAFKYANRYGYPDGNITEELAAHHGVKPENIMITAGSGELLNVVGVTFLQGGRKVLGVEPSYNAVYSHATSIKSSAVTIPLRADHSQDIPAMINAAKVCCAEIGFVYLVNPNNPTGNIVPKDDVRRLLDGIPQNMPVLIDEAYHHFVMDPQYETSVPYVLENRPVIIARTFSKISGLAGMRLGYAVAPRELIQKMRPWSTGTVNAIVKWGAVAALKDTEAQKQVRDMTIKLRKQTVAQLQAMGYPSIPSETNFFMLHIKRPVQPVIAEFRKKGVLVGRPFPPMTDWLRVSIGTEEEMGRFMKAFPEVMTITAASASRG